MAEPQDVLQDQADQVKPRRRRWGRRIALAVAAVFVLVFLVIALLPTLAGTGPGKNMILGMVNGSIDGRVEARSMSLGWLSGQHVTGVNVTGPDGSLLVDNLSLDAPQAKLLPIVFGSRKTGPINVAADAVNLRQDEQGKLNVPGSSEPAKPQPGRQEGAAADFELPEGVDTQLTVTIGKITYERPGEQSRAVRDFKTTAELRGRQKLEVTTTGNIEGGKLDAHVLVDHLTDAAGRLQYDKANIDANVNLTGIPVAPIDALAGQQGRLIEMLGDTLTTTATASGTLGKFTADVNLPALKLPAGEGKTLTFSDAVAQVRPGANAGDLRLTLNGRAQTGGVTEQVTLTADARNVFGDAGQLQLHAETRKLPVALVDALAGQGGKLTETLGGTLDLSADVTPRAPGDGGGWQLVGQITTPNVAGPFEAVYADELIEASTPQPLRFTITPKAYAMWTAPADPSTPVDPTKPAFAAPVSGTINLAALHIVMKAQPQGTEAQGLPIDAEKSRVFATIDIPTAKIQQGEPAEVITVEPVHVELKGKNLNFLDILASIEFPEQPANAAVQPQADEAGGRGKLVSNTQVRHLFDASGAVVVERATIHSDTTLEGVPGSLIDLLAGQQGKLAATTGPVVNGKVAVDYQPGQSGTAVADLDATNLKGRIPLSIAPGFSAITLTEDARLTLLVTEQTSESWLGGSHPLFADAVASDPEKPATLIVKKDDLRVPLDGSFALNQLHVTGSIDPGTLIMKRRGWIDQAINGVGAKLFNKQLNRGTSQTYPAFFSPMTYELKDGVVNTSELWLVSNDMGLGFQGSVDLDTNQIGKMSIGILVGSFYPLGSDIRKIDPQRVIEVPIKGAINSPRPDVAGLLLSNLDLGLDVAEGGTSGDTQKVISIVGGVLKEIQKQQQESGKAKYQFSWHPSDAAVAFADSLKAKPATTDEQQQPLPNDKPSSQQPSNQNDRNESPLRNLFEELRRQSQG